MDQESIVEALCAYYTIYSSLSYRSEEREDAAKYLHGLLLGILRKSIELKVLGLDGTYPEGVRVSC
jgi:hypothetical protein